MGTKNLSHEEIAQRFVDAKAFDFQAIGKLMTDLGPSLSVSDQGLHGIVFGRFNTIACMLTAADAASLIGRIRSGGLLDDIASSK